MPDRFRGRPVIAAGACPEGCLSCVEACAYGALLPEEGGRQVDLGRCIFCTDCRDACPDGRLDYSRDWRLAVSRREDLVVATGGGAEAGGTGAAAAGGGEAGGAEVGGIEASDAGAIVAAAAGGGEAGGAEVGGIEASDAGALHLASALTKETLRLFGRSLRLREVSAGGCNACEADVNVLGTIGWDIGRFGIQMVASPRHADGLLVTGPVTRNMELALRKTWDAVAEPKIVIAVGSCAIAGGPFAGHDEILGGVGGILPVNLLVPGCPPHPLTILDGLLRLLGRL
jgi:Ni,Fe-hydrogenase III small subunit